MEWLDILTKIEGGENERTEFKSSLDNWSVIGKAICAFTNTEGGTIILGVTDNQEIVGINADANSIQEKLTSFLRSGCSSPVRANLGMHKDPKGWVHWIRVSKQRGFEPLRYQGRVWVRLGRSSIEPSPVELQSLYNTFGYNLTEEGPIQAATISDIDIDIFCKYLQKQRLDTETEPQPNNTDDLRNRNVLSDVDGKLHPTLFGIMAFGKDPQKYLQTRNFVIECVAYEGNERSSAVLLSTKSTGRIDQQVRRSTNWLTRLGRFESYRGLIRKNRYLIPLEALRESLVNAVTHRDYAITGSKILLEVFEKCVEVTSPGGLPNHMSVESVRAGGYTRTRNESMAHYMVVSDFMEQRGRGWPVMSYAMRRFNGTEPDITQTDNGAFVRVRFYLKPPTA